jgi:hypothetical protein
MFPILPGNKQRLTQGSYPMKYISIFPAFILLRFWQVLKIKPSHNRARLQVDFYKGMRKPHIGPQLSVNDLNFAEISDYLLALQHLEHASSLEGFWVDNKNMVRAIRDVEVSSVVCQPKRGGDRQLGRAYEFQRLLVVY